MVNTPPNQPRARIETFDRLTLWGRRWFFRAVAANNEPLAQSEAYNSPMARDKGLVAARTAFRGPVVDL